MNDRVLGVGAFLLGVAAGATLVIWIMLLVA